ncbi:hypothetical protein OC844_006884 [Tilletia horrida]|nr:hypothetical protein OC844_006884 [Tilletia horrida]
MPPPPLVPLREDGSSATFLLAASRACGWIYTVAWSASFYPQTLLNAKRKSVAGLSIDFAFLNTFGFLCYAIFNLAFFASPTVRRQYRDRHDGRDNVVQINDVAFAVHALVLTSVTAFQTVLYRRAPGQTSSKAIRLLLAVFSLIVLVTGLLCIITGGDKVGTGKHAPLEWIDFVQILSTIKLIITFIKYLPQMMLNYRRKSTLGWSIENIWLDFTGGIFSLIQLFIDSAESGDWSSAIGDFSKLGLGLISIGFDLIFFLQHYAFYGPVPPLVQEDSPAAEEQEDEDSDTPRRTGSEERTRLLAGDGNDN